MSDNQDKDSKTEEPTQKKLEDTRKRGQIPNSREVNHLFILLSAVIILLMFAPYAFMTLGATMRTFVAMPHAIPVDGGQIGVVFGGAIREIAFAILGPMLLIMVAALLGSLIQNGPIFSAHPLKPKLEKISPMKGLKRIFSSRSLVEFGKSLFKLVVVGGIGILVVLPVAQAVETYPGLPVLNILGEIREMAIRLLIGVVAVMFVIAVVDMIYQRYMHQQELRMSKQEVKDEFKQTEGDPHIKARLRQLRIERSRRRMMAQVPEADVVITNPTHYAVALKYKPETMEAPVVVAKGIDLVANRIRAVAEENDISIVENPPLARALYATAELDAMIPVEHYKAVAEVISYVFQLKRRPMPEPA